MMAEVVSRKRHEAKTTRFGLKVKPFLTTTKEFFLLAT